MSAWEEQKLTTRFCGMRVLVVEHSWHVARAMKSLLESLGLAVPGMAGTLEDAEPLIAEQVFDLALVDINLKDGAAIELMERLDQRGVRVIALSSHPAVRASVSNAAAILQKPLGRRELLHALTKICSC